MDGIFSALLVFSILGMVSMSLVVDVLRYSPDVAEETSVTAPNITTGTTNPTTGQTAPSTNREITTPKVNPPAVSASTSAGSPPTANVNTASTSVPFKGPTGQPYVVGPTSPPPGN